MENTTFITAFTGLLGVSFGICLAYLALTPFRYRGKVLMCAENYIDAIEEPIYTVSSGKTAKYTQKQDLQILHNISVLIGRKSSDKFSHKSNPRGSIIKAHDHVYFATDGKVYPLSIKNKNVTISAKIDNPREPSGFWWNGIKFFDLGIDNIICTIFLFAHVLVYISSTILAAYSMHVPSGDQKIWIWVLEFSNSHWLIWILAVVPIVFITLCVIFGKFWVYRAFIGVSKLYDALHNELETDALTLDGVSESNVDNVLAMLRKKLKDLPAK